MKRRYDLSGEPRFFEASPVARFDLDGVVRAAVDRLPASSGSRGLPVPVGFGSWREAGYALAFASAREKRAAGVPRYWDDVPELREFCQGKACAYAEIGVVPAGLRWALCRGGE